MHRPGIAHARGNRIVLNGTTIDEVQRVHRDTLILCLKETNRLVAEHDNRQTAELEARQGAMVEHRRQVQEAARNIKFDE